MIHSLNIGSGGPVTRANDVHTRLAAKVVARMDIPGGPSLAANGVAL